MENKNNTKKATLIGLLLVAIATLVSVSFAYFTVNFNIGEIFRVGGKANSDTTDVFFTEDKTGISLNGTYPMTDSVGLSTSDTYTFEVRNDETDKNVDVQVVLEVTETSTLDDTLVNYSLNSTIKTLGEQTETTPSDDTYKKAYVIDSYTLTPGESKTHSLQIWINENGTIENAQNKTWSSKILVMPVFAS